MDIKLFKSLPRPSQNIVEWQMFLELVDSYFKRKGIYVPTVVELGTWFNRQKVFYEKLLGAEHIGIDDHKDKALPEGVKKKAMPDILGNTHDEKTVRELKRRLKGGPINLLFIDAGHKYEDVKRDYETYAPMTKNIIALHDIFLERQTVRLFWDEICRNKDYLTMTILAPAKFHNEKLFVGIGLVIKEW